MAPAPQARAQGKEVATVTAAIDVLHSLSAMPEKCIPPAMLCDRSAASDSENPARTMARTTR